MVLEKSWVSENFNESRNLNFNIESLSLANQAKVLITLNRHKITVTTTAKQRATER